MFDFCDLVWFVGGLFQMLGLLVFGVAAAWFTLYAFRQPERRWQLQIAVFLGFLFFTALMLRYASTGGAGGFMLGAGGALLFLGLRGEGEFEEDEAELEEE